MYRPEFHPKVDKEIFRLDKRFAQALRDVHIPAILQDPHHAGKALSGSLAGIKSYRFIYNRVDHRVIYEIIDERSTVVFLMIGPRENLYKKLLNRLR